VIRTALGETLDEPLRAGGYKVKYILVPKGRETGARASDVARSDMKRVRK